MYVTNIVYLSDENHSVASGHITAPMPFTGNSSDLVGGITIYLGQGSLQVTASEQQLRALAEECAKAADLIAEKRAALAELV